MAYYFLTSNSNEACTSKSYQALLKIMCYFKYNTYQFFVHNISNFAKSVLLLYNSVFFAVEETSDVDSTLIVSRQPCSSARTVTISSIQPENNKQCVAELKSILLGKSNNKPLFTYPSSEWISASHLYQYSAAVVCPIIESQHENLRWVWSLQDQLGKSKIPYLMNDRFPYEEINILTANNSKSKTPRDQTSVLGPEGRGASSWDESLGWNEPWAITSGARYEG